MKTKIVCKCSHAKSRHRQQYGEPFTGACRDCNCPAESNRAKELKRMLRRMVARSKHLLRKW